VRSPLLAWLGLGCAACAPLRAPAAPGVERIVFVGDSLVNRSDAEHHLLEHVRERLARAHPGRAFELVNKGVNGDCIAEIRARLVADVGALEPSVVVLYWDSDAADVETANEPPQRAARLRSAYERDLTAVLHGLRGLTSRVIVSGPTLQGELPHGSNPKDGVLDAYAEINRRLCHRHHATWVDTRQAAFRWLRQNAATPREAGRLTEDGEHLSAAGAALVAERLAAAISHHLGRPVPEGGEAPSSEAE
jgi:lysophospholipase L1-like esterase